MSINCEELTSYFKESKNWEIIIVVFKPIFEAERERNKEMIKQTLTETGVDQLIKDRDIIFQNQKEM